MAAGHHYAGRMVPYHSYHVLYAQQQDHQADTTQQALEGSTRSVAHNPRLTHDGMNPARYKVASASRGARVGRAMTWPDLTRDRRSRASPRSHAGSEPCSPRQPPLSHPDPSLAASCRMPRSQLLSSPRTSTARACVPSQHGMRPLLHPALLLLRAPSHWHHEEAQVGRVTHLPSRPSPAASRSPRPEHRGGQQPSDGRGARWHGSGCPCLL